MIRTITRPGGNESPTRMMGIIQGISDSLGLVIREVNNAFDLNGKGATHLVLQDSRGQRWKLDIDETGTLGVTQL